eukprot:gene16818-16999_t
MERKLRTSSHKRRYNVGLYDLIAACLAPILARLLRDPDLTRIDDFSSTIIYIVASTSITILVFYRSGIGNMIRDYFDTHDLITVLQACGFAVLLTSVFTFSFTRLDQIPRTLPLLHFLTLSGLIIVERFGLIRYFHRKRSDADKAPNFNSEYIIVVGVNRLAGVYVRTVHALAAKDQRIVGMVDKSHKLLGRSISGYTVIGKLGDLPYIIDEYAVHGIKITKIVMAYQDSEITAPEMEFVRLVAANKGIQMNSLGHLMKDLAGSVQAAKDAPKNQSAVLLIQSRHIWKFKRALDLGFVLVSSVVVLPLAFIVGMVVLFDVGSPILFWQYRVGRDGAGLHLYKFRTMRSAYDADGNKLSDDARLSVVGKFLRRSRLDELPQLWNILIGDMSIIGPRPLLPIDQPKSETIRLSVNPGLTGWAQVNGGKLINPEEKDALDEWYINNASFILEARIAVRTLRMMIFGERRDEAIVGQAMNEKVILPTQMPHEPAKPAEDAEIDVARFAILAGTAKHFEDKLPGSGPAPSAAESLILNDLSSIG